jgi:hypothetical protein
MFYQSTATGNMTLLLEILVLALSVTYLVTKHRQRVRARIAEYEVWLVREALNAESSVDLRTLAPRVRQVRADYLAEVRAHPRHQPHKDALVALARSTVRHRGYFHEEGIPPEMPAEHATAQAVG